MNKIVVTLSRGPALSLDFPEEYRAGRGKKATAKQVERSCFGAVRLYPGLPKTISTTELEYLKDKEPKVAALLSVRPYVESKRVDKRGCTEAQLEKLAAEEGVSHLKPARKLAVLKERGKIQALAPKVSATVPAEKPKRRRNVDG